MSLLGTLVDITAFTRVSLCVLLLRNRPGMLGWYTRRHHSCSLITASGGNLFDFSRR